MVHTNHRAAARVLKLVHSVILMRAMEDGNLTANHTHTIPATNGYGGVQECWGEELITGEEFLFVLVREISNEKVLMALVMTGPSVMRM